MNASRVKWIIVCHKCAFRTGSECSVDGGNLALDHADLAACPKGYFTDEAVSSLGPTRQVPAILRKKGCKECGSKTAPE